MIGLEPRCSAAKACSRDELAHCIKTFTLWEFVKAHWLTLSYFFKPKATINYPV